MYQFDGILIYARINSIKHTTWSPVPQYTIALDDYRGCFFRLSTRVQPDFNDVQEFAVIVHYTDDTDTAVDIVRIDTAHGYTHIDRLYRRDQPKDAIDFTWEEAEDHLKGNWRKFARRYDRTHGL